MVREWSGSTFHHFGAEQKQGCGQHFLKSDGPFSHREQTRSVVYRISACQSTQERHSEGDTGIERGVLQLKNKAKTKSNWLIKRKGGEALTPLPFCAKVTEIEKNGSQSVTLAVLLVGKK